ncbi:serine/threonine-protein kinase [uncultured Duncaniella sp.]|uniref:serine/threonine-protein kinase n=1 Tax=uncultured Duncaniella sp. TaxID=2768039 RepID=UPI00321F7AC3
MQEFNSGTLLVLTDNRKARVTRLLGEGAQGIVYEIMLDGRPYALKWYKRMPSESFIDNLRKNAEEISPSERFLWPMAVTRIKFNSIGYVMPLKPAGFEEFSKFRLAKVRFASMRAILNAAINTCEAFRTLHAKGLSFQDINDGGLFINPNDGRVLICDCDNVFPHGEQSGILGKARYIAPEVVMGKSLPDSYSDRFSMAVMLFMFFCIDHPFEGMNVLRHPCMTEEIERHLFGADAKFIYDPDNANNRPVHGVHRNALMMWPLLPEELKQIFISEFGKEKLINPPGRLTELQWIDALSKVRDLLTRCPECGDEVFASSGCKCLNPKCARPLDVKHWLVNGSRRYPLTIGSQIYLAGTDKPSARVLSKPGNTLDFIIQNLMEVQWTVNTPSGKTITIEPRAFVPVKPNLEIKFFNNNQNITLKIQ